jgi:hypothetical protein
MKNKLHLIEGKPRKLPDDKIMIEALKNRLNQRFQKEPELAKKAALLLETWLNPHRKK